MSNSWHRRRLSVLDNIVLETGKEFIIAMSSDDLMKDIRLYVTEDGNRIAEVATDGTETPIAADDN